MMMHEISIERFYWQIIDSVMNALPNDYRINKAGLMNALKSNFKQFDNPNTRRFLDVIHKLPNGGGTLTFPNDGAVCISYDGALNYEKVLKQLIPWRKGPFNIQGLKIDAEWQSNMKWDRFSPYFSYLAASNVLDVGCGNGYYMYRMASFDPNMVLGIDPSHLTTFQYQAIRRFCPLPQLHYLPIGWNDLDSFTSFFDVVFCMGIMYHHRSPMDLLQSIRAVSTNKVKVFFDTLIIDGDDDTALFPKGRYAQMPNVYFIPTLSCLKNMFHRSGFGSVDVLSVDQTTIREQRVTPWTFEQSLDHFLDPKDKTKTIEGYPAPLRVSLVASI